MSTTCNHKWTRVLLLVFLFAGVYGCTHHDVGVVSAEKLAGEEPIAFLRDWETTRIEVQDRLGTKCATFEQGKILVYVLDKKLRVTPYRSNSHYHLVLVFDEQRPEILKQHSLVQIK